MFKCLKFKCLKNLSATSPIRPCTLLAGPPLPLSERTYFMDDPKVIHNKETSKHLRLIRLLLKICI